MYFTVEKKEERMRLDRFLVEKLSGNSRAKIQKAIEAGAWLVNGKRVPPHYFLREGQKVEEIVKGENAPPSFGSRDLPNELYVIAETKEYIAIEKPAGMTVHGGPGIRGITLVDLLKKRYPEIETVGEDPLRPGIIHRLDKEVSGVMIVARTQEAFEYGKRQFQTRQVVKEYTALVHGTFVNDAGKIELPLMRSAEKKKHGTIKALPRGRGEDGAGRRAREAVTDYEVKQRFPRMTLLTVYPKTGRTHQIRVHCAAIGHPIVGDRLYRSAKVQKVSLKIERPFLHAAAITIVGKDGAAHTFHSPLPNDLQSALTFLSRD